MKIDLDELWATAETEKMLVDDAVSRFKIEPRLAVGVALRLGYVATVALVDIAVSLRMIKVLFDEEARRDA